MPRRRSTPPRQLSHHWFLPEWAESLGKTQADAIRELGWAKATASDLWNAKQRYTQDLVDEVSGWLAIRPYELLMSPEQAMAIRRLRQEAVRIAHDTDIPEPAPRSIPRTGTEG